MGTNDYSVICLAGDASDDAELVPVVLKCLDSGAVLESAGVVESLVDLLEQPGSGF